MQFGGARWSLGGPGWSPGAARGFPGGFGEQNECFRNGVFGPLAPREGVWGVPTSIIVRNLTPTGARLARKVLQDDNLAPFSSDKICEDFISSHHLHNLAPAGVRTPRDDLHSHVG